MKVEEWLKSEAHVTKLRAGYIDAAVEIDDHLSQVLASIVCPSDSSHAEVIRWAVLLHPAVSLRAKIEMLGRLGERIDKLDVKGLVTRLEKVNERRNRLAHGGWELIAGTDAFQLKTVKRNGEERVEEITTATTDGWLIHARETLECLRGQLVELNPWLIE